LGSSRERGEQEAGVVVDDVDHPGGLAGGERHLCRVDLPQVVRKVALEALRRLPPPRRLRRDQVVATQRAVDHRHRTRLDSCPPKFSMDPARAPARMPLAQRHDLRLELGCDLGRGAARPPRSRLEPGRPYSR